MAFPYIFESNFEAGTSAEWDSETDTGGILDFPHYKDLARYPWVNCAPYRGAYCARLTLAGGTTDATLSEDDCNISVGGSSYFRFYIWFSPNFTATANDTVNLLELQQDAGTVEFTVGARVVASTNVINLGVGETAPTVWASDEITRGKWHCIELYASVDAGGGANDGTATLYLDGVAVAVVAGLIQGAVGKAVFGIQDRLATTTGVILLDTFAQDDGQIGADDTANPMSPMVTKTGHVFVGPGCLSEVDLISGAGTDNVVTVYDTDVASTTARVVLRLNNTVASEFVPSGPLEDRRFTRGCYVVLSGTNPRALVNVCSAPTLISKSVLREYARGA